LAGRHGTRHRERTRESKPKPGLRVQGAEPIVPAPTTQGAEREAEVEKQLRSGAEVYGIPRDELIKLQTPAR
jgi:hypothetical protein